MIRIAVDGMGGDFAPLEIVKGAQSVSRDGLASIVLVGDVEKMKPYLTDNVNLDMVHTSICVEMHESPSNALRKKRDSSMNLAFELHKRGEVDAVVSAGNSGAAMAFAIFTWAGSRGSTGRPSPRSTRVSERDFPYSSMQGATSTASLCTSSNLH